MRHPIAHRTLLGITQPAVSQESSLIRTVVQPENLALSSYLPDRQNAQPMPECRMETQSVYQIACVDRMDGGNLVEFEDGKCALYSASLLRAVLPQAVEFEVSDDVEEPTTQSSDIVQKWAIHGRHRRQLNSSYL